MMAKAVLTCSRPETESCSSMIALCRARSPQTILRVEPGQPIRQVFPGRPG